MEGPTDLSDLFKKVYTKAFINENIEYLNENERSPAPYVKGLPDNTEKLILPFIWPRFSVSTVKYMEKVLTLYIDKTRICTKEAPTAYEIGIPKNTRKVLVEILDNSK